MRKNGRRDEEISKTDGILIIELVHRYWKASDLVSWMWRYITTAWQRLGGKLIEHGDYTETIRENKLTFHAFTTKEARKLLLSRGLRTRIEKRGKLFYDLFFVVGSKNYRINNVISSTKVSGIMFLFPLFLNVTKPRLFSARRSSYTFFTFLLVFCAKSLMDSTRKLVRL